jgi:hypothetical protein
MRSLNSCAHEPWWVKATHSPWLDYSLSHLQCATSKNSPDRVPRSGRCPLDHFDACHPTLRTR